MCILGKWWIDAYCLNIGEWWINPYFHTKLVAPGIWFVLEVRLSFQIEIEITGIWISSHLKNNNKNQRVPHIDFQKIATTSLCIWIWDEAIWVSGDRKREPFLIQVHLMWVPQSSTERCGIGPIPCTSQETTKGRRRASSLICPLPSVRLSFVSEREGVGWRGIISVRPICVHCVT